MAGRLYHLGKTASRRRAGDLLERLDLADAAKRQAKTYSGGMLRRLDLAASLIGEPKVLFLDEPTTGLDPRSRVGMWAIIRELVAGGTTLLLCTQYLDEADELADNIVVIDHGLVIASGTSGELKDRIGGDVVEFSVTDRAKLQAAVAAVSALGEGAPVVDDQERRSRSVPGGRVRRYWWRSCEALTAPVWRRRGWLCAGRPSTTCSCPLPATLPRRPMATVRAAVVLGAEKAGALSPLARGGQ